MKKIISILIMFAILWTCVISFADGVEDLQFGMSAEEMFEVMGNSGTYVEIPTSFAGILDSYYFENQKISKFEDARLNVTFLDNKLIAKLYGFSPDSQSNHYGYLKKALEKKYGASKQDLELAAQFCEIYGLGSLVEEYGMKKVLNMSKGKIATWKLKDKTTIVMLNCISSNDYLTVIAYMASMDDIHPDYDDSGL